MLSPIRVVLILTILSASSLEAQQVCDAALIRSTYNSFSSNQMDWRLATLVSEKDYNEIKQDAGGSAVITECRLVQTTPTIKRVFMTSSAPTMNL